MYNNMKYIKIKSYSLGYIPEGCNIDFVLDRWDIDSIDY